MRHAVLEVAVHIHGFHVLETVEQAVAQHADALVLGAHFEACEAKGLAHADDLVRGKRARAHAPLVAATMNLRRHLHIRRAAHI